MGVCTRTLAGDDLARLALHPPKAVEEELRPPSGCLQRELCSRPCRQRPLATILVSGREAMEFCPTLSRLIRSLSPLFFSRNRKITAVSAAAVKAKAPTTHRRRGRRGKSVYRGVCVTREGKWRAVIYKERKQVSSPPGWAVSCVFSISYVEICSRGRWTRRQTRWCFLTIFIFCWVSCVCGADHTNVGP